MRRQEVENGTHIRIDLTVTRTHGAGESPDEESDQMPSNHEKKFEMATLLG